MDSKTTRKKQINNNKSMTHPDDFKPVIYESLQEQVDGDHYKSMKIQPAEFFKQLTHLDSLAPLSFVNNVWLY